MFFALFKFFPNPVQAVSLHDFAITSFTPESFTMGALTALFFFWGWDVTLNLSEETSKAEQNPGRGAIIAMCVMLFTFIFFAIAMQMSLTSDEITASHTNIVLAMAEKLFPKPWSYMAVIAVMLSTIGTLETSILQFTRTMYAKGRDGVLNPRFAKLHPEWKTPWVSTILLVCLGLFLLFLSTFYPTVNQIVIDSVTAISFQVAFYYSLTGFACAKKFYKLARKSWKEFISLFLWPILSSTFLVFIGLYSLTTFILTTSLVAVGGIAIGIIPYLLNARTK
jgi:amino acid transporter